MHDGAFSLMTDLMLRMIEKGDVSDAAYCSDRNTESAQRANLLNILDEGENQGFETIKPEQMYFQTVAGFLSFMAETSEKLVADMALIETQVEKLSGDLTPAGARFLRSHVGGQAAMMRMIGTPARGIARAATAFVSAPARAKVLLERTIEETQAARADWYAKYDGRFKDWPVAALFVNIDGMQERVSKLLAKIDSVR